MKGIVNTDLNVRERPGVNSRMLTFYKTGQEVDILEPVIGDPYDGDDGWYKLSSGAFVWSGAVDVRPDCSTLSSEDRIQWLISYRNIYGDGRPNMVDKEPADKLFFTSVKLPAEPESIRLNDINPDFFVDGVIQTIRQLPDRRKHVFIYIHGYQLLPSLKLDLLEYFVKSYTTHLLNTIAKVLFMAWPAQGLSRKGADDRSIEAGEKFTKNDLFKTFSSLSDKLDDEGKTLNLIVHSFGHQLLNGMLNPKPGHHGNLPGKKIFKNIFLMAPDISHLAVREKGVTLENYFGEGKQYHYNLTGLKAMGEKVYVFHDQYDFLLYSSTKKFVGVNNLLGAKNKQERFDLMKDYRNLGNYGEDAIDPAEQPEGFDFIDVEKLIGLEEPRPCETYPFRRNRRTARKAIDLVWDESDYRDINDSKTVFNANRFPNHHRYLFTCKQVVDKVLQLLG